MTSIRFLHFTDLHFGMSGLPEAWPAVREALLDDLQTIHAESGPWDLVIFTGDLVGRGDSSQEFDGVRKVLEELADRTRGLGSEPELVVVPGNHDLARPCAEDPSAAVLRHLWGKSIWDKGKSVADILFDDAQSPYRDLVVDAFENYRKWSQAPGMKMLEPKSRGFLPGDFSTTYEKDDVRLGLLGLNTTFLQLQDDMTAGSLAVDARQLQAACDGDVPKWARDHDMCLLLTHHPPSWLNELSRATLMENVLQLPRSSFAMHLCGHLHEPNPRFEQVGGARPTRLLQGASLFGREEYGPNEERRINGYSACQLDFDQREIRVWPRIAERGGDGRLFLRADSRFTNPNESSFNWRMGEGSESGTRARPLPQALEVALARRVIIYKQNLRYKFTVCDLAAHTMRARVVLSYELVNATEEPQSYQAGFVPERKTEYIAASWGGTTLDLTDSRYRDGNSLEFPVQLPPGGSIPVRVEAITEYGVPDAEGLTTFIPSLDFELELVRQAGLRLRVQWRTAKPGEVTQLPSDGERYTAAEPVLANQGLQLTWMREPV
jgi:predicted MPP superfamily phosphohydrolase